MADQIPDIPVLLQFTADWCNACQTMYPVTAEIADDYKNKLRIIPVDVDKNRPVAQQFNIRSVPTLICLKEGKEIWRKTGLLTRRELTAYLDKIMNTF